MDKNVLYPILSILIVLVMAAGIYYVAAMFGGTEIHHEGEHEGEAHEGEHEGEPSQPEASTEEAEALFFAAMEKPLQYEKYIFAYTETASNGYTDSVFVTSSGEASYVRKEDAIFTRELFLSENRSVLCLENVNRRLCTEIVQNSTFNPYKYTLSSLLYNSENIEKNKENNEFLIEHGAIVFEPNMSTKAYAGEECTEIAYTLDYSKLTVEQMRLIGMDPQTPEVLLSKEYNFTLCIDPETKDVVYKSLSYLNFGVPETTDSITTQAEWGTHSPIEFPEEIAEDADIEEFYEALKMSQQKYAACLIDENFESCIRTEAILSRNEKLCELIIDTEGRDGCYLNVALEKGVPLICEHISTEVKDDCFMEFAWKYKDTSYCGQIENEQKQNECLAIVTEPEEETPEEPVPGEPECTAAIDCVRAGCSSQLCVPLSQSDVVTTCEYLEEYDCLPLTTCGCYEGKCGWDQNQEYLNCLEEKRTE